MESCIQLCPVGNIGLLEDGLGSAGVLLQGFGGFRTQGEVCNHHIAACFEETERKGEGDTTAAASNESGLAIKMVDGHFDRLRYKGGLWISMTGREAARECRVLTKGDGFVYLLSSPSTTRRKISSP